jgi:peroxiredoxin
MKKAFVLLSTLALTASTFAAEIGKPAPDFTATDIHGKTVKLSDYAGKIVVLESYNSDCPFCQNEYNTGAVQDLQAQLTAKGVVWLIVDSVNANNFSHRTPAQANQEWSERKIKATDWLDDTSGAIGHLYDMKTTPDMYVIAKDGTLAYEGAMDDRPEPDGDPRTAHNYVRAAVDSLIAGKPVAVTETKPYGCGVHYAE